MNSGDQLQFLERIFEQRDPVSVPEISGILREILVYHAPEDVAYAMGDFGTRLREFAATIYDEDAVHPDIFHFMDGQLCGHTEGSFSKDACDLLKLVDHGKGWGLSQSILENLQRVITTHKSYRSLSQAINPPRLTLTNVRFVANAEMRNEIRCQKRMQEVNLNLLYNWGQSFWDEQPANFLAYKRFENRYQKDIDEARRRHLHFSGLGLRMMADEIEKSITQLESAATSEQYFGFNKITITTASVILAKQVGYKFDKATVQASPDLFKYNFFYGEKGDLFDDRHFETLHYKPRAYACHEMKPWMKSEIHRVIEHLENFPEANGRPLFDHFRVVVAGLDYPSDGKASKRYGSAFFRFRKRNGEIFTSQSKAQAQMLLDLELIDANEIPAILVGERGGECYFICYF